LRGIADQDTTLTILEERKSITLHLGVLGLICGGWEEVDELSYQGESLRLVLLTSSLM
jgi:hypothetical protein